jgi:sporulation protein YabP
MKRGEQKMAKEEQNKRWHNLVLEDRKVLKASGVSDVEGFDETKIYAMLEGLSFTILGKNLKVISFSAESGNLIVEGEIDSVSYSNALSRKAGFFERIFR